MMSLAMLDVTELASESLHLESRHARIGQRRISPSSTRRLSCPTLQSSFFVATELSVLSKTQNAYPRVWAASGTHLCDSSKASSGQDSERRFDQSLQRRQTPCQPSPASHWDQYNSAQLKFILRDAGELTAT